MLGVVELAFRGLGIPFPQHLRGKPEVGHHEFIHRRRRKPMLGRVAVRDLLPRGDAVLHEQACRRGGIHGIGGKDRRTAHLPPKRQRLPGKLLQFPLALLHLGGGGLGHRRRFAAAPRQQRQCHQNR